MKTMKQAGVNLTGRKFLICSGLITTLVSLQQYVLATIVCGIFVASETVLDFRKGA
jgi:hypothetical protein